MVRRFFVVAGSLLVLLTQFQTAALAQQDVSISAFYGVWRGNALSESNISTHFRVTARDLDVEIRPVEPGGFMINWATVLRQKGDPNAPAEVLKEARVTFLPDATRQKVWRAADQGDPMGENGFNWARLEGQTLTIYGIGVAEDGSAELQIYRRTLTDLGMQLDFTRTVDSEPVRSARGKLIKFAQ
ncbi:hypothetical protein [Minwuia sp.]|uniref:hypothetical protein n=1 Tax=Minwuia sp. TaxID=2493630 RepID=UPI003A9121C9